MFMIFIRIVITVVFFLLPALILVLGFLFWRSVKRDFRRMEKLLAAVPKPAEKEREH